MIVGWMKLILLLLLILPTLATLACCTSAHNLISLFTTIQFYILILKKIVRNTVVFMSGLYTLYFKLQMDKILWQEKENIVSSELNNPFLAKPSYRQLLLPFSTFHITTTCISQNVYLQDSMFFAVYFVC